MTFEQMFYIFVGWTWLIILSRAISAQLLAWICKDVDTRKEWALCIFWLILVAIASHMYDGDNLSNIVLH